MKKNNFLNYKYISFLAFVFIMAFLGLTACNRNVNPNNNSGNVNDFQAVEKNRKKDPFENLTFKAETTFEEPSYHNFPEDIKAPGYNQVKLTMVGDMLLHMQVHRNARMADGSLNYDHLFTNVKDKIKTFDIAIVNQEVILGGEELGLSGYPTFNSPYEVADAIAKAGFNVALHATNHTIDKGVVGVTNCVNYWQSNYPDIAILGINESQEAQDNNIYVYEKDDLKIAILNYTYGTNGIPLPKDMPYIVNLIDKDKIKRDVEKARELADFVVVAPHWGVEYVHKQSSQQDELAQFMADIGVDLVIGTHPHVIQPVEWLEGESGNKMLIYYSIGNFVNATNSTGRGVSNRMLGAMAEVTIEKLGDEAVIIDYGATPVITHKDTSGPGRIKVYFPEDYSEDLARKNEVVRQDPSFSFKRITDIWNEVYPEFAY